jgi:hypothetical protein
MSPITKIITLSLTAGLISSLVAAVCAFLILQIFFDHFGIVFGGSPYSTSDKIISLVSLGVLLVSLAVCPYAAYYLREDIYAATSLPTLRILLFLLIGSAQFGFLAVEYFTVFPTVVKAYKKLTTPPTQAEIQHTKESDVRRAIDAADIDVTVQRAKILHDDGRNLTAEFRLQIKNVPAIVDDYSIEVRSVNGEKGFVVGTRNFFRGELVKFLSLKAVLQNERWIFYGQKSDEIVSQTSDEVPFRVNFFRTGDESRELPQTVTPYLRAVLYDENKAFAQFELFDRPVPVKFENY